MSNSETHVIVVSEAQRRVDRGRRIVAQQRELVGKVGKALPLAVSLLETCERTLALLEDGLANYQLMADSMQQTLCNSKTLVDSNPAEVVGPQRDNEEQLRHVARILEILREGGYHCELAQDTLH